MLTTKYISLNQVLSRLLMSPMMEGITESDVALYVADCMSLIGAPMSYHDKVQTIEICNYRGELPCDMLYIQQTRKRESNGVLRHMRYSSDTFHSAYHEVGSPDFMAQPANYDFPYSLNNGMIYTSFESGTVEMSYKAIPVDKEGFPMVPEDSVFQLAIEWYVKEKWYTIQWELGKITDKVLNNTQQQCAWYIGKANTRAQLQSIDQAETFKAAFTRLLSNSLASHKSFSDFGRQEYIKIGKI